MHSNEIRHSETQARILDAAVEIVEARGADGLRILDVAAQANVGAPTIYYYYSNRHRLVAAAQATRLGRILSEDDSYLDDLRIALKNEDRAAFIEAAASYDALLWGPESEEAVWQALEIISSVRHEPVVRDVVAEVVNAHLSARLEIMESAQEIGWLDPNADAKVWVNFYFSACLGRVVVDLAPDLAPDGEDARHGFMLGVSPTYT